MPPGPSSQLGKRGSVTDEPLEKLGHLGVNKNSPTPLYHQIYVILKNKIYDGSFPYESAVPSEKKICDTFGVSRITAKRALDDLASANLVIRRRGGGTRVCYKVSGPPVQSSVEGLLENLLAMGLKTQVTLLEFDYESAPLQVSEVMNCERDTIVQKAVRVRELEGRPFSYLTTWVPEDIGRTYSKQDIAAKPLLMLLERGGSVVSGASQTIAAAAADAAAAQALDVDIGSPLLKITRVVLDQTDRVVEYFVGQYRPDRYQFQLNLNRVDGEENKAWSPSS